MKNEKELSIIIPNYNKEKYLSKCLDSLLPLINEKVEIIVVDDCSTDNSISILEKYNQIKLIKNPKNMGVSESRNNGIKQATGRYLCFIDSDDYVDINYVNVILDSIKSNGDLYIFDVYNNGNNIKYESDIIGSISLSNYINYNPNKFLSAYISYWVWNKVFKREIIEKNNLNFPKLSFGEDEDFCMKYFFCIDDINFINKQLYFYCESNTGLNATNKLFAEAFNTVCNNNLDMFMKYECDLSVLKNNIQGMYEVALLKSTTYEDKILIQYYMDKIEEKMSKNKGLVLRKK